jgi:hypothetical protein
MMSKKNVKDTGLILKDKLMTVGSEKLADILLSLYDSNNGIQKQLDIIFAGLEEDPKKITSMIRKEIAAYKRSTKFVDYYESGAFADRLDALRLLIVHDLSAKSPQIAFEVSLEFLDLHKKTLDRVDDSNGVVAGVFSSACEDLGKVAQSVVGLSVSEIVEIVFSRFMNNDYGIYDGLIHNFKEVLEGEGFTLLQDRLEKSLSKDKEGAIKCGLEVIADCKNDVDAFIRACSFTGKPNAHDHLDIAKRLITHWRSKEALNWLDRMEIPGRHQWQEERRRLRIEALELEGEYEKAQSERLSWFETNLSPKIYGQILKNAKSDFKESFKSEAIQKAFQFYEPHASLYFLIETQEFEEAAKFVRLSYNKLDGGQYYTLRPAADILQGINPIAATLLYRKMIEPVLEAAKSKYYNYAAKDLVMCGILDKKISEWGELTPHEDYLKELEVKHKRKLSFWSEYELALQKQAVKDAKQAARHIKDNSI